MDLEESPLWPEVELIINSGPKPIKYYWKADIHFKDETHEILKVVSIDNIRNYEAKFSDEMVVETVVPMGVYAKLIYPNRNILEITLYKQPLKEAGDVEDMEDFKETERFKAVPILEGLPVIEATDFDKHNQNTLDLTALLTISFQVFNAALEKLRLITIGGIYRNCNQEDVIKGLLKTESLKIKVRGQPTITAVDMVPADNKEVRKHTLIPQGVKLLSLPTFLQERCNGVYSTGIGNYLQKNIWWVYPLYNTKRFSEETRKTAVLFKVPERRLVSIERTYRIEGKTIFIIGTSKSSFKDDANTEFMNKGDGFRLADARQFLGDEVLVKDNKAIANRKKLNHELLTLGKDDNVHNTQVSSDEISANPYVDYSKLVSRDGGVVEFIWENSNPKYLIPGMMIKYYYMDHDELQMIHGVLLYNHVYVQLNGQGVTVEKHVTTCYLGIFVTKVKK